MTDYKSLSISDLKAIMDYCHRERIDHLTYAMKADYKYAEALLERKQDAESELQSRLGVKAKEL